MGFTPKVLYLAASPFDRLVQRGFEFEEIAALAVCRKSGIAFGLGLLRQIGPVSYTHLPQYL